MTNTRIFTVDWLIDWLVCCLLASPDLWKRMLLKCSITMVYTCPRPSWCKFSFGWQGCVTMETIWKNTGGFVFDLLKSMLLVSRSGHSKNNAVNVFHHYVVHLSSSLLMQIFSWLAGLLLWRRHWRIQEALYTIDR